MKAKRQEGTITEAIKFQEEDNLGEDLFLHSGDFPKFADLSVTDEELDGIKGGDPDGPPRGGGWYINNSNETTARDEEDRVGFSRTESSEDLPKFADLALTDEETDDIKGGSDGTGRTGGDWIVNHNEIIVSDEEL